jgi:hypothetical protein
MCNTKANRRKQRNDPAQVETGSRRSQRNALSDETISEPKTNPRKKKNMTTESLAKTETVHVHGSRLQPICRKLGIAFSEHFSHWQTNSNRRYPDRRVYNGVDVSPDGAEKLNAYLAEREAKEQRRAEKVAKLAAMSPEERQAIRAKKQAAQDKRVASELAKITAEVNRRWTLDTADVAAFAAHANEPGEGRVLRTKTACTESFEQKVYMALVAWVRHTKTPYEDKLSAAKDAAYADYQRMRPNFDAGERWDDMPYSRDEADDALATAREEAQQARNELHAQYTAEAVEWLKQREVKL